MQTDGKYQQEIDDMIEIKKKKSTLVIAVRLIGGKLNTYKTPLLRVLHELALNNKISEELNYYKEQFTTVEISDFQKIYQEIRTFYTISDEKLVEVMFESLFRNTSLNDTLITCFNNLTIFDMKTLSESQLVSPISEHFKLTFWNNIKQFPEASVRNYFGEKITLYFSFIIFFRDRLVLISILGIVILVLQYAYYFYNISKQGLPDSSTQLIYQIIIIVFCMLVTIWASYFGQSWERYEKQFSTKYGVTDLEEDKQTRSSFKGKY